MTIGLTKYREARVISVPAQCLELLVRGCAHVLRDAANSVSYFHDRDVRTTATLADAHAELDAALMLVGALPPDVQNSPEIRHAMVYAQPTIDQMVASRNFDVLLHRLAIKPPDATDSVEAQSQAAADRKRGTLLLRWIAEVLTVDDHFFDVMCTRDFVAERATLLSKSGSCCELGNVIDRLRG